MLHAVVMAGGSGTRFWPASRQSLPKQFLKIGSDRTLLQETVRRCEPLIPVERQWVVTGASLAAETARQLPQLSADQLIIEPCARNTAPCIALAAVHLLQVDADAVMLVVPADHVIQPSADFRAAVERAVQFVEQSPASLLLFGVRPTYPATGFGYLQRGAVLPDAGGVAKVAHFREKPSVEVAAQYLEAGNYFWNCGIFVWKAATILQALAAATPEWEPLIQRLQQAAGTPGWKQTLAEVFPQMPATSIDYAVLEKADTIFMQPADFGWDDVGSWGALSRLIAPDSCRNTVQGLHVGLETRDCILRTTESHLLATVGVENLIVVHTPQITLVASRNDEAAVKSLTAEIQRRGLSEYL